MQITVVKEGRLTATAGDVVAVYFVREGNSAQRVVETSPELLVMLKKIASAATADIRRIEPEFNP